MICRKPAGSVVFTGAGVVRRKRLDVVLAAGARVPREFADFDPSLWAGASDYQRYEAWDRARRSWADQHLPNGAGDLPWWLGVVPDQPWNEVVL